MNIVSSITGFISKHKLISLIVLIVLCAGGYVVRGKLTQASVETRYVIGTVSRGTILATVSGTGQVSASNQLNVQSKTSGPLIVLNAVVGQSVKKGQLIAEVDPSDSETALETAKLSYQQLVTVDPTQLRNAQNAVTNAQTAQQNGYVSARSTLASASTDMTSQINTLTDQFVGGYIDPTNKFDRNQTAEDYVSKAQTAYYAAKKKLDAFTIEYSAISNASSDDTIATTLTDASDVALSISQAAKYTKDAADYLQAHDTTDQSDATAADKTVSDLVTSTNSTVSQLLSANNTLNSNALSLKNEQDDLATLQAGPSALDTRSSQLSIDQKQQAYDDNFIYAPFDGVIAEVPVQKGDNVSTGSTIVTLITQSKVAKLSLNEIDAAKVKVGQKATLTFDAIDGLSIAGEVESIDLIGTVSQGVVSYDVQISFDTNDARVKPGMTVTANIVTDMSQNVLTVPSSAIKTVGGASFVEVPAANVPASEVGGSSGVVLPSAPVNTPVTLGLSDDTSSEVLTGLTEGQQYIVRTIAGTAKTTTSAATAPSLFGGGGGGAAAAARGGGGFTRNRGFGG